jgi:hypothetical protein
MKSPTPTITHVEILCRAIRSIEEEIRAQEEVMGDIPEFEDMLAAYIAEREPKVAALKEMYRVETGNEY